MVHTFFCYDVCVYVFILNVAIKVFCMEFGEREREKSGVGGRLHVKQNLLFCCFFSPQVVVIDTSKYFKKKKNIFFLMQVRNIGCLFCPQGGV